MTTTFLYAFFCCLVLGRAQWGLENLGERISSQVQQSLRPLQGLGARINGEVQQSVQPLQNLGSRISGDVERELAPLDNLGAQISQQVYEGLEPVRILQSIIAVKQGSGGVTVATFSPSGKRYVIRNGHLYECSGAISESDGSCSGTLQQLKFDKKEDFCYVPSKSIINNWYCIPSTGSTRTSFINGNIICQSGDGSPSLLIEDRDYRELCKNVTSASYKYFTNNKLKHVGNGLQCSGSNPQVCTFSETLTRGSNYIYSSGSNIVITNSY